MCQAMRKHETLFRSCRLENEFRASRRSGLQRLRNMHRATCFLVHLSDSYHRNQLQLFPLLVILVLSKLPNHPLPIPRNDLVPLLCPHVSPPDIPRDCGVIDCEY